MNSKRDARKSKTKLNPDAKEFIPSSSNNEGASRSQKHPHRFIKDRDSDGAFMQQLVESRKFWKLSEKPFYEGIKCATCKLKKIKRKTPQFRELDELTHDAVKMIAYHLDCEDKSKEYECKYCIARYTGEEEEDIYAEHDLYDCGCDECEGGSDAMYSDYEDERFFSKMRGEKQDEEERRKNKVYKKRNQKKHFEHLVRKHESKLTTFLRYKQDIIPMCETTRASVACEWELSDMFQQIWLYKSHKYLHMEVPPRRARSTKNTIEDKINQNIRNADKMIRKLGLFNHDDNDDEWDTDDCSDCSWETIGDSESHDEDDDEAAAERDDIEGRVNDCISQ